jgi:hypothetical protein
MMMLSVFERGIDRSVERAAIGGARRKRRSICSR